MTAENFDWKNAFRKNRVKIVKGLANPDEVGGHLYQMKIFNDEMYDTVKQIEETEKKTRKILDLLNYRGKKGVAALHEAFLDSNNEDLAKDLAPYVMEVEKRDNKTEPLKWPPSKLENEDMLKDQVIKLKDPKSPWCIHDYGKDHAYTIQNECRGKVFIINNVNFNGPLQNRVPSNIDAENLTKLFIELHFTVLQENDLTAQGMQSFLRSEAKQLEKEENCAECVILIIMSHGVGTKVYGVDCLPVEIKELTDCFSTANCESLHGKPRLVFIQACRSVETASINKTVHLVKPGGQVEIECIVKSCKSIQNVYWEWDKNKVKKEDFYRITEWNSSNKYCLQQMKNVRSLFVKNVSENDKGKYRCIVKHDDGSFSVSNFTDLQLDIKDDSKNELPEEFEKLTTKGRDEMDSVPSVQETQDEILPKCTFLDHPYADFLIAYATPEGTSAWLNNEVGSWFMNAIVWTFKYHAHEEELHHLLIRVNRLVGKEGHTKKKEMTVAEVKSNLRKKFYFFPGIHSNPPELFK
ncbi:caspase-2-like isoform X2 [Mytilus californianus]|uniref:caspase-2-like isoform X2 n=1 Tax=Mytilus californianus TaxID=6549 RepID=UPI002245A20E|nr:caspase-2-like isoform X2 [Mytilus californianus]